ncbi:hypothetical protein [Halorubrum laminariae]|uniref:Uncharacterized protein n=1 Tax=Halorubrum laminariae TaxID=1433523 RepID=A0ABD6C1U8_9EURY|nr:hypothetical protein [Halorubrum laminariae]
MGFYYHSEDLEAETILRKCANRLDDAPTDIDDIEVTKRDAVLAEDLIESEFTSDWVTANYTESGAIQLDTPYPELNKESREKEQQHLKDKRGQFFYVIGEVSGEGTTVAISALAEIRGRAAEEKVEYFIEEYTLGRVDPAK